MDSKYLIENPKQIIKLINSLMKKNCLIAAKPGHPDKSFLTAIIKIDEKKNQLILDYGPQEYLNKQLINSRSPQFCAELDGVQLQFTGTNIKKMRVEGQSVFALPIPSALHWMQRRIYYRLKIPAFHQSYCLIPAENTENRSELRFKLLDISVSGFSFHDDQTIFTDHSIADRTFNDCQLVLNGSEIENISFAIVRKRHSMPAKSNQGNQFGCKFLNMRAPDEAVVSRYMKEIELGLRNLNQ